MWRTLCGGVGSTRPVLLKQPCRGGSAKGAAHRVARLWKGEHPFTSRLLLHAVPTPVDDNVGTREALQTWAETLDETMQCESVAGDAPLIGLDDAQPPRRTVHAIQQLWG